jgi:hypothetical protein
MEMLPAQSSKQISANHPARGGASTGGHKRTILSALLAAAAAIPAAQAAETAKPADPTVTLACFGSEMGLMTVIGSGDKVSLSAVSVLI